MNGKNFSTFSYIGKYWALVIGSVLFMIAEVSVDLYQPRMMRVIVDFGVLGLDNNGTPDINLVLRVGLRMILIVFVGGFCGVMCGVLTNLCGQNFGNDIRKDCFREIMHFSFAQTDKFSSGSLITRITNDVTLTQNMIQQLMRGFVRCMMFLFAGSYALVSMDADYRIVILVAMPLILLNILLVLRKANPLFDALQKALDKINTLVQENIAGARVVKAFNQEEHETQRFEAQNRDYMDIQRRVLILLSMMRPTMNIILNCAVVAVIKIGAVSVQNGSAAPGVVMAAVGCTSVFPSCTQKFTCFLMRFDVSGAVSDGYYCHHYAKLNRIFLLKEQHNFPIGYFLALRVMQGVIPPNLRTTSSRIV